MQYRFPATGGGSAPPQHLLHLFDTSESLGEAVSTYLAQGLLYGDPILVVSTASHWNAIAVRLQAGGVPVDALRASGHITVHEASDLLSQLMSKGLPDPARFRQVIGGAVQRLAAPGARPRVYGELVNLLAAEGDLSSARRIEELWNALAADVPFALYCGYAAEHFGDPRTAASLRAICAAHSHVQEQSCDMLGNFLLNAYACRGVDAMKQNAC